LNDGIAKKNINIKNIKKKLELTGLTSQTRDMSYEIEITS
jgi:hypothetical protein